MARRTRAAREASNGARRSRVLATGSSIAAAATSLSLGCSAVDSSILGLPICRAKSSHSSMARSGSASRRSRGVSSCSAAVTMLRRIGFGRNVPSGAGGIGQSLVAESRGEEEENHSCKDGWVQPDRVPVVNTCERIVVIDEACGPEADQHADAVGGEGDQSLRGGLMRNTRLGVGVDLTANEEEVITDSVQRDADDQ